MSVRGEKLFCSFFDKFEIDEFESDLMDSKLNGEF